MEHCSNCSEKLTLGFISRGNELLSDEQVRLINAHEGTDTKARCNKCGDSPLYIARQAFREENKKLIGEISAHLQNIRIATIHSPHNWDYNVLGMISAQSTTGTGVFSEISSTITDILGTQSQTYNKKLKDGEDLCTKMLRQRAFQMDAHAVIGADIDYAEVGGAKGMLMVCMSGTAVTLNNPEILGSEAVSSFKSLKVARVRLGLLAQFEPLWTTM